MLIRQNLKKSMNTIIVTGGAGFIGGALVRHILTHTNDRVINIDKLTYAGNLDSLLDISNSSNYSFKQVDICDYENIFNIYKEYKPNIIMNLAAESHVDRSISNPDAFLRTNILGTYNLLKVSLDYLNDHNIKSKDFLFHHISTDEVFGDLELKDNPFSETSRYQPSSPYSASKASSDHLVRAWSRTYGLRAIITNCSNNYGPYQFPEKLIPTVIISALTGKKIPVYGDGSQIRDWLFVEDHVKALYKVVTQGVSGETYNIGGNAEMTNLEVIREICSILEKLSPHNLAGLPKYESLISFSKDRPGHDKRYAINCNKIKTQLGWGQTETFKSGIEKTVKWFLDNKEWWEPKI